MEPRFMVGRTDSLYRSPENLPEKPGIKGSGLEFKNLLLESLSQGSGSGIHVSSHAEKRLRERNITMDDGTRNLLLKALEELKAKGSRDSLVVTRDAAFLLNVPTRTLVTAMGLGEAKDRIITQIDSVSLKNI